jgi:hypothetical protein
MLLCPLERAHHRGNHLVSEGLIPQSQSIEAAAAIRDDGCIPKRFSAETVLLAGFQTEDVRTAPDTTL